jgi:hypothetical protein
MRLMFVHYVFEDRGSAQDIHNYATAARALGHEVALYGRPKPRSAFNYSQDIESADAVIFILEWTADLQEGDHLDWARFVARVPRDRRVIIDCDGKYNDAINVVGDYNHAEGALGRRWIEICDSLSDKVYQPTYRPKRSNVGTFFFHAYNPAWELPLDFSSKEYGMFYVGHNWFRWRPMYNVLSRAIEPVRSRIGRIGIAGHGWASRAPWANSSITQDAYFSDPGYLNTLDIEVLPPIRFGAVIEHMSKGVFTPVIYRPLFNHLELVTCRTFETPAASTIPLFGMDEGYVREIYGEPARELVLPEANPHEKVLDILDRPGHYAEVVAGIRIRLAQQYSYEAQLQQLIGIVEGRNPVITEPLAAGPPAPERSLKPRPVPRQKSADRETSGEEYAACGS